MAVVASVFALNFIFLSRKIPLGLELHPVDLRPTWCLQALRGELRKSVEFFTSVQSQLLRRR